MSTVCIRDAAWVAAWDETSDTQVYRRNIDVAFKDDIVVHVGPGFEGQVDEEIDGRALFVMPGLIDIHSHPHLEPSYKGIREEHGVPEMYMTGLYERGQAFHLDEAGRQAGAEVAYSELLASGVTSIVDLSSPMEGWFELVARSGIRGFVGPGYASARWRMERAHELLFNWDEAAGERGLERALSLIDEAQQNPSGRLSGVLYPAQIDTCTESLLRDSVAEATRRGIPVTTHASQSVVEFKLMVDRHGVTPVQWAQQIGLLGPNTILGHAIFIDEHSWLHWWSRKDLALLAESGTSVAHCPSPFARYGQTLQNFGRYVRAGVNMGMGTDVSPHNLLEEMRLAAVLARVSGEDIRTVETADLFHAATIGGAKALLRDDLGRLGVGKKADLVLVDLDDVTMMPARDPLRSLIYTAAERAVRDVYVDGRKVVSDRKVTTLDRADAAGRLTQAQARMEAGVSEKDYLGRGAVDIVGMSLPVV
jgi:cytosine/adenosine deaminase-related metal-dependent hydrolase